jgi:hypothetical protein
MSTILTPQQVNTLVERAMRDSALKQALLDHPHAAVQSQLGVEVPAGKTLRVIQAPAQTVTVVIPSRPADWPDNLSVEAATARLRGDLAAQEGKAQRTNEVWSQLTARAWQDAAFTQRLIQDPKAAVSQELAVSLPNDFSLQVFIDDPDQQHLILPSVEGEELSDEQLERVAGGGSPWRRSIDSSRIIDSINWHDLVTLERVPYVTS